MAVFKQILSAKRPDIEWVAEQWPPQGKIDAGAVAQALPAAKPEAILNVTFGADLVKFVREGNTRGLFKDRAVVSFLTGEPEYLDPLKEEAPEGWIVTGYPWYGIKTPEHDAFLKAYQAKYNDYPRLGSVVGYTTMKAAAAILAKAGSTDTEKLVEAAAGVGRLALRADRFRASDHQSTLGAFVGKTAIKDGKGVMVDFGYRDGAKYLPSDDEVKKLRPQKLRRAARARGAEVRLLAASGATRLRRRRMRLRRKRRCGYSSSSSSSPALPARRRCSSSRRAFRSSSASRAS